LASHHGFDVAALRLLHRRDVGEDVTHTELLGAVSLQERRKLAGVEVISVVRDGAVLGRRDRLRCQPGIADLPLRADSLAERAILRIAQPVWREVQLREPLREHERMIVALVLGTGRPARKSGTLFEGGIALAEELRL
jgi:hypothetical protein